MHARKTFAFLSGTILLLAMMLLPVAVDARSDGYAPGVDPRPVIAGLQPDRSVANIVDEDFYTLPGDLPDTLRVMAIRVHFQPDTLSATFGDGDFMYDYPDTVNPDGWLLDPPPHDRQFFQDHLLAARNYFSKFSNGKLTLAGYDDEDVEGGDVYPKGAQDSYQLDYPIWTINYGNDDEQRLNEQLVKLFADSWTVADQNGLADDLAADGRTVEDYDIFIIFHAGSGNEFDTGYDLTPFDIPSVFISENDLQEFGGLTGGVDFAGSKIPNGLILPETQRQLGTDVGMHGTVVAQLGFAIGLPHLYDTEDGDAGIGMLGLMDRGFGAFYGTIPIPPSAWSRIFMRWDEPVTVSSYTTIDTVRLGGLHLPDSVFSDNLDDPDNVVRLLRIPINDTEYYLAEVRRRDPDEDSLSYGWDRDGRKITFYDDYSWEVEDGFRVAVTYSDYDFDLPSSGVLLWHIDDQLIRNRYADDRIQNDFDKRGIRLQEADGTWDIGKDYPFLTVGDGTELGWADDAFYRDNDSWSDANRPLFNPEFSTNTNPSSTSNDGGQTHLTINKFSDIADTMTFRITNGWIQDGFPIELSEVWDVTHGDINGDDIDELIVHGSDGTSHTVFVLDSTGVVLESFPAGGQSAKIAVADMDQDGSCEIVAADANTIFIAVYSPLTSQFNIDWSATLPDYAEIRALAVIEHGENSVALGLFDGEVGQHILLRGGRKGDIADQFFVDATFSYDEVRPGDGFLLAAEAEGAGADAIVWFNSTQVASVDLDDGSVELGWITEDPEPDPVPGTRVLKDAIAADFDGDGETEYIGTLEEGRLLFFEFVNGQPVGRSVDVDEMPSALRVLDMDHDGDLEPAWLDMSSKEIVSVERDGLLAEGTPFQLSRKGGDPYDSHSIIFDSDGDGNLEWFTVTEGDGNSLLLSAYDLSDGQLLPGFPLPLPNASSIGEYSMIAANIDSDDSVELIVASNVPNTTAMRITAYDLPGFSGDKDVAWGEPDGDPANTRRVSLDLSSIGGVAQFTMDDAYCWPNPVLAEDIAHFRFPNRGSEAEVTVYDIAGREQLSKRCTWQGAGMDTDEAELELDVSALPSGVYVARLEVGGEVQLIRFSVVN
ncbi:T9SS type A sorting domain-containing protein [bacterium]|nr:T9SS type A sorting domain-containing protein [bacterium]